MAIVARKALVGDGESIARVAGALQIGDDRPKGIGATGFLLWAQTPEVYDKRISLSDHFVVAEENGEIVGFLMAYSLEEMSQIAEDMAYEDEVLKIFNEQFELSTIYPDQIGVLPSYKRKGIGSIMNQKLLELAPSATFATVSGHAPIRNEASIGYFTSCGYEFVTELAQDDWVLGLYRRAG